MDQRSEPVIGVRPIYPHSTLADRVLNLLFPPVCTGCRRIGRWICPRCWDEMTWTLERTCLTCHRLSMDSLCRRCRKASSPLERVLAVTEFEGAGREAVHALKYHGRFAIAGLMGTLMADMVRGESIDVVTNVPLHRSRRRERGFDQAEKLAIVAANSLGVPYESLLSRNRRTQQQARLDLTARLANVKGAFASRAPLTGERVLLIDDVSTTGATIEAAALALRDVGAGAVVGAVFAHSPLD